MNVLLITADQLRPDALACYGHPFIKTPHIDALAAEGVRYSNCFVQTVPCGPSRMCLFSSKTMSRTGVINNQTPYVDAEENLGQTLMEHGITPHVMGYHDYVPVSGGRYWGGKWDFLPGFRPVLYHDGSSQAYLDFLESEGYEVNLLDKKFYTRTQVPDADSGQHAPCYYPALYDKEHSETRFMTHKAFEAISGFGKDWFFNLNYIKPHPPRVCPAPYHHMYMNAPIDRAIGSIEAWEKEHPYLVAMNRNFQLDSTHLHEIRANYFGMISEVDDNLGLLFAFLKEKGMWEDTLIIFTSDHGEFLGYHGLFDKAHFYDDSMHVPLIVKAAKQEGGDHGQVIDTLVESLDIAPTILDHLEIAIPVFMQGKSLGKELVSSTGREDESIRHEFHFGRFNRGGELGDDNTLRVIRTRKHKYVHFKHLPDILFDLEGDPGECHNVIEESPYRDVAERLKTLVLDIA